MTRWLRIGKEQSKNRKIYIYNWYNILYLMRKLENLIKVENLERAKDYLVPHIFTENYYNILKAKLKGKKLTENERYYYSHFIKKKLLAIIELTELNQNVNGGEFIMKDRLKKAISLLRKYSRKHKNMKMFVSGSFLYSKEYSDIDIFVISKYSKEDYREGKVHVNYLPADAEKSLFFHSVHSVSVSNFVSFKKIEEKFKLDDILHLYEIVILLIMQKDDYLQELRGLVLRLEYTSNKVILNSMQLKTITDKIIKNKRSIEVINKYLVAKIINSYNGAVLKKVLSRFLDKNKSPEKGQKIYGNWKVYNQTYKEAMEVVA